MNRYLTSLGITSIVYLMIIASFFYNKTISNKPTVILTKENKVSFYVIKEQEKTIKKIKKKIIKKRVIKKKIVKQKIIKKAKIFKKKIKKKIDRIEKEKIVKKEDMKKIDQTITNKEEITKKPNILNEKHLDENRLKIIRNKYFILVKRTINNNKSYPKSARRRAIEGSVNVKFELSNKGELVSFHILSGHSIFFKATSKALQNSFPILPPKELQKEKFNLTLNIKYNLH